MAGPHPVQLTVRDDLRRRRLTVFFRLILAIPHIVWFVLWSVLVIVLAIAGWICALVTGRLPASLHRIFCSYIKYSTRFLAYLWLVADRYPEFSGTVLEPYAVEVALPEPAPQRRLLILFRLLVAIPAILLSASLSGGGGSASFRGSGSSSTASGGANFSGGLIALAAVGGWFASLATGRMPRGLRDAGAYALGYRAQTTAYLLLVTERYPNSDPHAILSSLTPPPLHPVRLEGDALDLRRSRLTTLFRLPLLIPLLIWGYLWALPVGVILPVQWLVLLVRGRPIGAFHRFTARFLRYQFHVWSFASLAANPFPGFTGLPGIYPLDLVLPPPARQSRWKTLFRLVLVLPPFLLAVLLLVLVLLVASIFTWFAALATGRAPEGLRNLSAWVLRYAGQVYAYYYLLTDRYPHSSPLEGAESEPDDDEAGPAGWEPEPAV